MFCHKKLQNNDTCHLKKLNVVISQHCIWIIHHEKYFQHYLLLLSLSFPALSGITDWCCWCINYNEGLAGPHILQSSQKPGRGPNRFLMSTKFHSKNQGRSISTNNYSARDSARMIGWEIMSQPIKSNIDYCPTESWGWSLSLFHMITYILKQHFITQ